MSRWRRPGRACAQRRSARGRAPSRASRTASGAARSHCWRPCGARRSPGTAPAAWARPGPPDPCPNRPLLHMPDLDVLELRAACAQVTEYPNSIERITSLLVTSTLLCHQRVCKYSEHRQQRPAWCVHMSQVLQHRAADRVTVLQGEGSSLWIHASATKPGHRPPTASQQFTPNLLALLQSAILIAAHCAILPQQLAADCNVRVALSASPSPIPCDIEVQAMHL